MRRTGMLLAGVLLLVTSTALAFDKIEFGDPKGDDKGPGAYTYPTHAVYTKDSFDLREVTIEEDGDDVKFTVTVGARIEDPWDSPKWQGKGWSVQMIQIYVDTDHKAKSGHEKTLPGMNVRFADESWWEKAIILSPQPDSRIEQELTKAPDLKADVILPRKVTARGKTFTALVKKSELGTPVAGWGWQVLVQSNEGYPDKGDILSRKVNEFNGEHRFGGGTDYDCDPHVMDILADPAKGGADEAKAQYKALEYKCDPGNPEDIEGQARIPMIYR